MYPQTNERSPGVRAWTPGESHLCDSFWGLQPAKPTFPSIFPSDSPAVWPQASPVTFLSLRCHNHEVGIKRPDQPPGSMGRIEWDNGGEGFNKSCCLIHPRVGCLIFTKGSISLTLVLCITLQDSTSLLSTTCSLTFLYLSFALTCVLEETKIKPII